MPTPRRAPFPTAPELPPRLDLAPAALRSDDVWEAIEAGSDVEVDERVIDAELSESRFTRAQLLGRHFTGLVCRDVRLVQCDLAGAVLEDAHFTRVTFESCRLSGAIFAGATLRDVSFTDSVADLADFRMAQFRRTVGEETNFRDADFYGAQFVDVRLTGCSLERANFDAAQPQRLDLRGSTLDDVRGPASLRAAHIDANQVLPLGMALVRALNFRID